MDCLIAGICGGSCSGKSTLVSGIVSKLDRVTVIHFDDFFSGQDKPTAGEIKNWEDPALYRIGECEEVLNKIRAGEKATIKANSRESRREGIEFRNLIPNKYVIFEGFLIYLTEGLRKAVDRKIFLDIPEEEIINRRYARMRSGGGYYSDEYIRKILIDSYRRTVLPQKRYADLVIDATKPREVILGEALGFITGQGRRVMSGRGQV